MKREELLIAIKDYGEKCYDLALGDPINKEQQYRLMIKKNQAWGAVIAKIISLEVSLENKNG